jgi:hypothetical protein
MAALASNHDVPVRRRWTEEGTESQADASEQLRTVPGSLDAAALLDHVLFDAPQVKGVLRTLMLIPSAGGYSPRLPS